MSQPRVGVLHAPFGAASLRDIYTAAHGVCQVVLLARPAAAAEFPEVYAAAARLFPVEIVADGAALDRLDLAAVTTFTDGELDTADEWAGSLAGGGFEVSVSDKLHQRHTLRAAGLSGLRAVAVDSVDDFRRAVTGIGPPCVVKPRRGVSGAGISFVGSAEDVEREVRTRRSWSGLLVEERFRPGPHPSGIPWLGGFVSVETVTDRNGRQTHLAVFDKLPIATDGATLVTTTGDLLPSRLPADVRERALANVSAALDALKVRSRLTHTELWVGPDFTEIIEINGRVGGHLNRLVRMVSGGDLVRAALEVAATGAIPDEPWVTSGWAAGLFPPFPRPSGRVESDVERGALRRLPGVYGVDEHAKRGEPRASTGNRVVNLTVRGTDAAELDSSLLAVLDGVVELYRADSLDADPWWSELRASLRASI